MKKKKKIKISKVLIILTILLSIILIVTILIQLDIKGRIDKVFAEPKLLTIEDKCSLIMNNLLHEIKNEDDCKIRCNNQCNLENMRTLKSEFITPNNSCYACKCYCK
jgi:hypothetical protein